MRCLRSAALVAALLSLCFALAPGESLAKTELWKDELPIRQPWLREHLPDQSLVYVRVPHLFGLFATPKGNALDQALRSKANVENVQKIRQGIVDNVLMHIPAFSDLRLRLLEQHLRSPIEVSLFTDPAPSALITVNLDIDSNTSFTEMLELMGFGLAAPLDDAGNGQIIGAPAPMFVQFDTATGRLLINAGPAASPESFSALLDTMNGASAHRMLAMEQRIDESGQGLFVWIDAAQALPAMQMFMPPEELETFTAIGLDKVSAAAFGWGVANGKGRLSIVADVPTDNDRGFLPYISNTVSARSVGNPDGLMVLSIPTAEEFSRLESLAMAAAPEDKQAGWNEGKAAMAEFTGVSIEEIFEAIGPELIAVFDEAGDYAAIRVRDAKLWDSILDRIAEKTGNSPDERRIGRKTYYHWSMPNEFGMLDEEEVGEMGWFAVLMRRQRDHLYWTRDGEFLYFASVPQILMDRARMRPRTDIGQWLREDQRIDVSEALISINGTSRKVPKRLYAVYIEMLALLADVAQVEIDIWSMPTAGELDLPDLGTLGFTLSLGNPTLAAEFTFENNPGELLGGMGGVAMAGILAAIAIPAYQDYTTRAKISEGLALAGGVKAAVAEYYYANGRYPGVDAAAEMSISVDDSENVWSITVEPDTGVIIIDYTDSVIEGGGQVFLDPYVDPDGFMSWSCAGSFENKHLPAACRNEASDTYDENGT